MRRAVLGTWHQVNNVERRWRPIRTDAGLEWITPHTIRKTVATLISPRVDAETASRQLGHSSPAITWESYISKPAIAADVAHVLAELAGVDTGGRPKYIGHEWGKRLGVRYRTGPAPAFPLVRAGSICRADRIEPETP